MPTATAQLPRERTLPSLVVAAIGAALIALFLTGGAFVLSQPNRLPLDANGAVTSIEWTDTAPENWTHRPHEANDSWRVPSGGHLTITAGPVDSIDASFSNPIASGLDSTDNDEQVTQKFAWEQLGLSPNAVAHATKLPARDLIVQDAQGHPIRVELAIYEITGESEHLVVGVHVFNETGQALVIVRGNDQGLEVSTDDLIQDAGDLDIVIATS